jgi:hypothetical protein
MYNGVWKGWTQIKEESFWEDGEEWRSYCTSFTKLQDIISQNTKLFTSEY